MISRNKQWNNIAKLEERKVLVDSTGTKGANLEDNFLFLWLHHGVKPQTAMCS